LLKTIRPKTIRLKTIKPKTTSFCRTSYMLDLPTLGTTSSLTSLISLKDLFRS